MWAPTQHTGIPIIPTGVQAKIMQEDASLAQDAMTTPVPAYFSETSNDTLISNFPYALETALFGREADLRVLENWFGQDEAHPLCLLTGIAGIGKSALAWHWADTMSQADPSLPIFWWDLGERDGAFANLIESILIYFGDNLERFNNITVNTDRALYHLGRQSALIIIKEAEAILPALQKEKGGNAGRFLTRLSNPDQTAAKMLLIAQWLPNELRGKLPDGICRHTLGALTPQDAYLYLSQLGLYTSLAQVILVGEKLRYHPYSLRLLAGVAGVSGGLNNVIEMMRQDGMPISWRNVLAWSYQQLPATAQTVLHRLVRRPHSFLTSELAKEIFAHTLDDDIDQLLRRGFIFPRESNRKRYFVTPRVTRRFLAGVSAPQVEEPAIPQTPLLLRLATDEQLTVNPPVRPFHAGSPIDEYRLLIEQKRFDDALAIFRKHLAGGIDADSNGSHTELELLRQLFPPQPGALPNLTHPTNQAWAMSHLAELYSRVGRPRLAISMVEHSNKLNSELEDKGQLANGLRQLAINQRQVGSLAAADHNLRRSIALCKEIDDPLGEAASRMRLGRVSAICGHWVGAAGQLDTALNLAEESAHLQLQSNIWAHGAWLALMQGEGEGGLISAQEALRLLTERGTTGALTTPEYIRLHWLLGWSHTLLEGHKLAKMHLDEAVRRAHTIGYLALQPAILLARARLARSKWMLDKQSTLLESVELLATDALGIAQRTGYVLEVTDAHLLLAETANEGDNPTGAYRHANEAYQYGQCDGEPFTYALALEKAMVLLSN